MRIANDYGHNDNYKFGDTGSEFNGYLEQDFNFQIGKKVTNLLKFSNVDVIETRPNKTDNLGTNTNSSLSKRVEIANNSKSQLFISFHCNKGQGNGSEVFIYKRGGEAEKIAEIIQNKVYNKFYKQTEKANRGVKEENYYILRKTNMSAILIELGFIDTEFDRDILINKQDELAYTIYEGICEYLDIKTYVKDVVDNTKIEVKPEIIPDVKSENQLVNLQIEGKLIDLKGNLIDGTTYVPLRKLCDELKLGLEFNSETFTANIIANKTQSIEITNPIIDDKFKYYMKNSCHIVEISPLKFGVLLANRGKVNIDLENYFIKD